MDSSITAHHVSGWYNIRPEFADAVLSKFAGIDFYRDCNSIEELYEKYPRLRQQLEYAFSTNIRGAELALKLQKAGVLSRYGDDRAYLDIGCAYGGFLSAFSETGFYSKGIEMDPELASLGRLNVSSSLSDSRIMTGDFLQEEIISSSEKFDLITCNDVIEHVFEPESALKKIYSMLKPGGIAFLETVNKRSIVNLRSEIHSGLFGISLLDHHSAVAAYREYLSTNDMFQISDFYFVEWYENHFRALGAEVTRLSGDQNLRPYYEELSDLWNAFKAWEMGGNRNLSSFTKYEIKKELFRFSAQFHSELSKAHELNSYIEFARRWIDPIIRVLVRRPMQ